VQSIHITTKIKYDKKPCKHCYINETNVKQDFATRNHFLLSLQQENTIYNHSLSSHKTGQTFPKGLPCKDMGSKANQDGV